MGITGMHANSWFFNVCVYITYIIFYILDTLKST